MFGLGGPEILGILVLLATVAVGIVVFVVLVARVAAKGQSEAPRAALDRRYASGEITREQYLQIRSDLEGGKPPA
jgi:uncharacterized membrane protein